MGTPVIRPKVTELTAQGAAYLAGLEVGFWKDFDTISSLWKEERRFTAQMPSEQVREVRRKWAKAIECAQTWEST